MAKEITFHLHPHFLANEDKWRTYRDLYEGEHSVLVGTKYLWPHELESSEQPAGVNIVTGKAWTVGEKLRTIRSMRSQYLGLFETLISNYVSLAFMRPMDIDASVKSLFTDAGMADVDGEGNSFEDFIKGPLATAYFRDGQPILQTDTPDGDHRTLAEQRAAGFRPFWQVLDVLEVLDWQRAQSGVNVGNYELFRYEFELIDPRTSLEDGVAVTKYTKVYSLREGAYEVMLYKLVDKEWKPVFTAPHVFQGWDELPLATTFKNDPWVKDLAPVQLTIFNLMSAWYNQLNAQGIERVFIATDGWQKKNDIAVSEFAISLIPADAKVTVLPPTDTQGQERAIEWHIDQMYRIAFNRNRGLSGSSKEAPGADTIREMNMELIELLKGALSEMESIVNTGIRHWAKLMGQDDFTGKVTFDKDLKEEDVEREVQNFLAYRDEIKKVLPWRKAHLKKAVRRENFSEDELKEIEKAIDALKEEKEPSLLAATQGVLNGQRPTDKGSDRAGDAVGATGGNAGGKPASVPGA